MNQYDEALRNWYRAGVELAGRTNGMWPGMAPQNAALPYITYDVAGDPTDNAMGHTQDCNTVLVVFEIRSGKRSPKEVGELYDIFKKRFDDAAIPLRGFTTIRMDRAGGGARLRDPDGGWVVSVTYGWLVQLT